MLSLGFRFFGGVLGVSCTTNTGHKITIQKNILLCTILPVTSFSTNCSKTQKFRLKCEIKYNLYLKFHNK